MSCNLRNTQANANYASWPASTHKWKNPTPKLLKQKPLLSPLPCPSPSWEAAEHSPAQLRQQLEQLLGPRRYACPGLSSAHRTAACSDVHRPRSSHT